MHLASRGTREIEDDEDGDGAREIRDQELASALRRKARTLHLQALLLAAMATAVLLILPL